MKTHFRSLLLFVFFCLAFCERKQVIINRISSWSNLNLRDNPIFHLKQSFQDTMPLKSSNSTSKNSSTLKTPRRSDTTLDEIVFRDMIPFA